MSLHEDFVLASKIVIGWMHLDTSLLELTNLNPHAMTSAYHSKNRNPPVVFSVDNCRWSGMNELNR